MIESLNECVTKIKPEINLDNQVNGLFKISGMTFDIYYLLGESDPLHDALVGLAELKTNTGLRKKLLKAGNATVLFGTSKIRFSFSTRTPYDQELTAFVASYPGLINIILPSKRNWKKAGLGWLLT